MHVPSDKHRLLPPLYKALRTEQRGMVQGLRALIPIHEKEAYVEYGFSSLYTFLVRHCQMSNASAFRRKVCVPLVIRHPKLLEALSNGTITLSNLALARNILNHDNIDASIALLAGKSSREVENLVAALDPKRPPKTGISKISERNQGGNPNMDPPIVPVDHDLFKLVAVFDAEIREMLHHLQEMMRRENPTADPDYLFREMVVTTHEKWEKKLFDVTCRPRNAKASKDPTHISSAVKREVYKRDGGQCTSVDGSGKRCPSRAFLEFDHIDPRCNGGTGSAKNVRLLCSKHHKEHTKATFGAAFIDEKIAERKRSKRPSVKKSEPNGAPAKRASS